MNRLPFFHKAKITDLNFRTAAIADSRRWLIGMAVVVVAIFLVLFLRLFQLTIVKHAYFQQTAEDNHNRALIIEAQRGRITDRKGFVIAQNTPPDLHALEARIPSSRTYYDGMIMGNLIGYRQIADAADMENNDCRIPLQLGDKIGKKGVEALYDCRLRGRNGKKLVEVNAQGKLLHSITVEPAQPGSNIQLAIDLELEKAAYEQIKDKRAAVVVLDPPTGAVLAMVSTPSFDPQDFENGAAEAVQSYLNDPAQPLFNRATAGTYPPGSIFKLMVAIAGLEEKKIDAATQFEDKGILQAGPLKFGNWYFLQYGKTEGMVDLVKAIQRSNDIFFYQAGEAAGPDAIKKWALRFGLGKKTGIGLEEAEGLVPSPFWKQETLKDRWYLGDSYNLAIGQGYTLVTPLQIALATAAFANNGYLCQPQLLKNQPSRCEKLPVSGTNLSLIQEGMRRACATGGTGWPLFDYKIKNLEFRSSQTRGLTGEKLASVEAALDKNPQAWEALPVACKTGTAETHGQDSNPHAWFTAYAPADNPQIVVTVLVENAGQGSDVAAPIAKQILTTYFERSQ
ncbi:penicillin-binding transpeptidase domain-containing protein [Patescibacteria group bacterium]|nr:penicillin-binding transpeptidase domain-containing protein [Patescibacteria group bacterium]MCL5091505.1 penicillin-binding transpeptidase domain-containing protein [Patescibacteria group bacterium]